LDNKNDNTIIRHINLIKKFFIFPIILMVFLGNVQFRIYKKLMILIQ